MIDRRSSCRLASVAAILVAVCLTGCASTSLEHRAVQALAAGAEIHNSTMQAAGYASAVGAITPEQLAKARAVGRRVELTLRAARAGLEIHLLTRGDATAGGLDGQLAEVQAALLELVRVAAELGLEVGR